MNESYICGCGKRVIEGTGYDSSDQPFIGLFEVLIDDEGDGCVIRKHYWNPVTCAR